MCSVVLATCDSGGNSAVDTTILEAHAGTALNPGLQASINSPSEHPVGREWREQWPEFTDFAALGARAYAETQRHIAKCMAVRGFEYRAMSYVDGDQAFGRLMNPLNESVAVEYGYHVPPDQTILINENAVPDEAMFKALNGSDDARDSGCAREAAEVVRVPFAEFNELLAATVQALDGQLQGYYASEEYIVNSAEWSECMAESGYELRTQEDATRRFVGSPQVTEEERAVRAADLACDRATGLTANRSSVERAIFERWVEDSVGAVQRLAELSAMYGDALDRLERALRD